MNVTWLREASSGLGTDPGPIYPAKPLTPFDIAWRYSLASVSLFFFVVLTILELVFNSKETIEPLWFAICNVGCGFIALWLIRYRRRYPLPIVLALIMLTTFSYCVGGFYYWAMLSLATRRRWRPILVAYFFSWVPIILDLYFPPLNRALGLNDAGGIYAVPKWISLVLAMLVSSLVTGVVVALGFYVGARRDLVSSLEERALAAEHEQFLHVEQGKADERSRIAREMHDVLAHRISLVSMHAGVLVYRDDLSAAQTKQIASTIQDNAHQSLVELRAVLADLRHGPQSATPQPTLADLATLVDETRAWGTVVALSNRVVHEELLPTVISRHCYRIVQESLTNTRKHAAQASVQVTLWGAPGEGISMEVRNQLTHDLSVPGTGMGLVGLQERATSVGGTLSAGVEQKDFVVRAWLPWSN
ncbi:MAG: histidine kinase [Propionibacteriaceae bacterium]